MFYDDLLCSITNSICASTTGTNGIISDSKTLSTADSESQKNAKYFSELKTLYILGKHYPQPIDEKEISADVMSRIWCTYRKGFSQINGNGPDSDVGWGCMLRCGQMLLAETFSRIYLARDFKWDNSGNTGNPFYWKILKYISDDKLAPYSVQQIAMMGVSEGIQIGKWFGPNTIVQVLNKLTTFEESNHLRFYIAMDNCVFIDEIYEQMKKCNKTMKCKKHSKGVCNEWSPLLLIIPLRLGLNEFNQDYKDSIKKCFHLKQTVGMIGGKPNQAYFFYGYADDDLLYMDPHEVQPYIPNFVEDMNDASYHTNTMWKLKFSHLDPSVALGFLCTTEIEFLDLIDTLRADVLNQNDLNAIFEISETRPTFEDLNSADLTDNASDDEFVFI